MDGTNRMVLHNTSLTWPNALTLDIQTQTLYWADAYRDKVEASGVNGSNRRVISTSGFEHPFAISILNTTLYLTDWRRHSLEVIYNFQGSSQQILKFCGRPSGIRVVDPSLQPTG